MGRVAEEGNCAVHLVDHTSKAGIEGSGNGQLARGQGKDRCSPGGAGGQPDDG